VADADNPPAEPDHSSNASQINARLNSADTAWWRSGGTALQSVMQQDGSSLSRYASRLRQCASEEQHKKPPARVEAVAAQTSGYTTELVNSPERFVELSADWDALASQQRDALMLHGWYRAAMEAQELTTGDLAIVILRKADRLVAAAPLQRAKAGLFERLVPVDAFAGEPDRLLFEDEVALQQLGAACASLGKPILIRRLDLPQTATNLFAKSLRSRAFLKMQQRHSSNVLHLPSRLDELEASVSASRRRTLRRKYKAARQSYGQLDAQLLVPEPAAVDQHLARFAAIEHASWKGQQGTSLLSDPRMRRFVSSLAHEFAASGKLAMTFLTLGGRDAAGKLMLSVGGCWNEIKIGYDEQFASCSPGIILTHETMRHAIAQGISTYRFLGLAEDWQAHWPTRNGEDRLLASYPFTQAGIAAGVLDGWRAMRRIVTR